MSRYTLIDPGKFSEVVIGWDASTDGFFLQCVATASAAADDGPAIWRSGLSVCELRGALSELELELPDLALRLLEADERGVPVRLAEGDPALWRGSPSSPPTPCTVIETLLTFARVRWPNGNERLCLAIELEPDFARVGIE